MFKQRHTIARHQGLSRKHPNNRNFLCVSCAMCCGLKIRERRPVIFASRTMLSRCEGARGAKRTLFHFTKRSGKTRVWRASGLDLKNKNPRIRGIRQESVPNATTTNSQPGPSLGAPCVELVIELRDNFLSHSLPLSPLSPFFFV